ncbi:MAG: hypothetical protein PHP31_09220, partial [Lentimicrobiaceae bacterium]|nr:hypothetical protein [Lentimicrobiaceae bacterium]
MAWFNFLKSEGYFDPDKNPEPIQVNNGFQIPFWEVLSYLEKLSIQISEGKETELIDELLDVIKNVSEHPKDNYRTWYIFIKILSNIPNDRVPKEILHFIPVWLSGKFDTMLQTSELCDKLLPKFLNDEPTQSDIEKAEIILHYLFQVEKNTEKNDVWNGEGNAYHSNVYLHFLADKFEKRNIITKIVKHCSPDFILNLGRTLKFLLLDYPKGIKSSLKDGEIEYEIIIQVEKENLSISSKLKDSEDANVISYLTNWEDKNEDELKKELVLILKKQNINYKPSIESNDTFQQLCFALNTDLTSLHSSKSIRKLDDRYSTGEKVLNIFSLIFRDLLDEQAKQNPEKALKLLKTIFFDSKYRIPFFKRVVLYVICENWDTTKSLFWELVKENDNLHLFSYYEYQKELFDLLNKNQNALNNKEIKIIENIIERGKQVEIEEEKENEYWKLGWYSALKEIEPFKDKYLTLSKELNITSEHYEYLGEIRVRSGSISPITIDELLRKNNQEIVEYIKTFNPQRSFGEPSISGLSGTFGDAVEANPEKFATEIERYQDIPYIYSYHMLNAFGEAWKKQKAFNWEKVLQYCLSTLKSPKFYSGELKIENDDWQANSDLVVGSIANILTYGTQNDDHSFDTELLPLAKEIILIIVSNLKRIDVFKETNMDYPTYSLNSTAGKSLRALLDYSLYRARNLFKREDKEKWETDIKSLFEETLQKGIIDGFILEGMYYEQFCFLDYEWIINQVKKHYKSEDREWLAFMGGLTFGRPPYNKELYTIFYPHYERAIDNNIELKSITNNGLVNHLTAFYFWKYETISSEKLLFKFINHASPDQISKLINFIRLQKNYPITLSEPEQREFYKIIIGLWEFLIDKYKNSNNEAEQKNLAMLSSWIVFIPELNEVYTTLILKSCKHIDKTYYTHELLKELVRLKTKGNPEVTAKAIGKILASLNYEDYITKNDQE